jgi:hypothetical protein
MSHEDGNQKGTPAVFENRSEKAERTVLSLRASQAIRLESAQRAMEKGAQWV